MNETVNLHLPQFAATDRIHHDDFNDAFAKLDAVTPRLVFGTYAGDSAAERVISLPSTPKAVYVCLESGIVEWSSQYYGGLAFTDHPARRAGLNLVEIVENGFCVGISGEVKRSNSSGSNYHYVAVL